MKSLKHTLIILYSLILLSGLFSQETAITISSSANYLGGQPPESILDGEIGTSFRLMPGATGAWIRLDFSEACYLEALEFQGFIPQNAQFSLQTETEGITNSIPMGYLSGPVENTFLDLSRDKQIIDNLIIKIEGPNLVNLRIDEIYLTCRDKDEELHKKRLIPEELYYAQNKLNNDFLLVDGKIGTVWRNLNQGVDHVINWLRRTDGTRVSPESDDWAIRKDIFFTIENPGPMEFFKYFLTDRAQGEMTLYVMVEENWVDLGTYQLGNLSGWQKVNLKNLGEICRIRMSLEDPSKPWNRGEYGGIGEVELWARAGGEETLLQDIDSKTGIFSIAGLEEKNYLLQLVSSNQDDRAPIAVLNGYSIESSTYLDFAEYRLWEYPLDYKLLQSVENDLKVELQHGQSLISSHLISRGEGTIPLSGEEIFHDGLRHSSMNTTNDPLFLELLEGEADIEEILLYFKDRAPTYLEGGTGNQKIPLYPLSENENPLRYSQPGLLKNLTLQVPADLQEVEVLGSANEIISPYVEILFPLPNMHLPQYTSYSYKVVGITDCPDAHIEINGITAQISDNFFWVEMRDLNISNPGYHNLLATVLRSNGESSEDSIDVFMESDSNKIILDQEDKLFITWDDTMEFTGKINGNASRLMINGEEVRLSHGKRFSSRQELKQGLNRFVFRLESPDGTELYQEESRRVLRQSTSPTLKITQPINGEFIKSNNIEVKGSISPWGLEELRINDQNVSCQGDQFIHSLNLNNGETLIRVEALYSSGIRIHQSVEIQRDSENPQILEVNPEEGYMTANNYVQVRGTVIDNQEVSVFINGKVATLNGNSFRLMVPLSNEGANPIQILARDLAGNESTWPKFNIYRDSTPPEPFTIEVEPSTYTQVKRPVIYFETTDTASGMDRYFVSINGLEFFEQTSPYRLPYLAEGTNQIVVRAMDKLGNFRDENVEITLDTQAEAAPGNFRAVPGNERVLLRWSDDRDDIAYFLIGSDEEEGIRIDVHTGTNDYEIPFEELETQQNYRFYIQAVDQAGNIGQKLYDRVQTSMADSNHNPQIETLLEYDGLEMHMLPGSLTDEVDRVVMEEIENPGHVAQSRNPVISPIYNFKVEVDGELLDHAFFDKPFEGRIHYDENLIPEYFPEEKLAVFYYNEDWCTWLMADSCIVDTEENTISFLSDHFTEYNVQATITDQVDYRDWDGLEFPIASESTSHSQLEVSPQNGALSTSMTEFVLPGKNGLDLEVRRTYSTTLADSDSTLLPINDISQLNGENQLQALRDYLDDPEQAIQTWNNSNKNEMLYKRAELSYALGQGWRLDFPYIRFADKDVMIYIPGQGTIFSGDLKKEFVGDNEKREISRYTDSLKGRGSLEVLKKESAIYSMGGYYVTYDLKEIIFTEKNGRKYTFNNVGLITSISDPYENSIDFTYEDLKLVKITDSYDREVLFSYLERTDYLPVCNKITVSELDNGEITYQYQTIDQTMVSDYFSSNNEIPPAGDNFYEFGGLPLLKSSTDIGERIWEYEYALTYLKSTYKYTYGAGSFGQHNSRYYPDKCKSVFVFPLRQIEGLGVGFETVHYQANSLSGSNSFYDQSHSYKYMYSEEELRNRTEALAVNTIRSLDEENIVKKTVSYSYDINEDGIITKTTINDGRKSETYAYKKLDFKINYPEPPPYYAGNPDKELEKWQLTSYDLFLLNNDGSISESPVETRKYSYSIVSEQPTKIQRELGSEQKIEDNFSYDSWGNVLTHTHIESSPSLTQKVFSYYSYTDRIPEGASRFTAPDDWDQTNVNKLHEQGIYDRQLCSYQRYETNGRAEDTLPQIRVYAYNDKGNLSYQAEMTQDLWATQKYAYYDNGNLSKYTNPRNLETSYIYGFETITHIDTETQQEIEKNYRTIENYFSIPHISSPETLTLESILDTVNTSSRITKTIYENPINGFLYKENQGGVETTFEQDLLGRIESIIKPIGDNNESPETTINYRDDERSVTMTDSLDNHSIFHFNLRGEIVQIQKKNSSDELIQQIDINQDYYGNISTVTTYPNIENHLIESTTARNTLSYTYDGLGRILTESYEEELSSGDPKGSKSVSYDYDDEKRFVTITNEANQVIRQYLDPSGRVLKSEEWSSLGSLLRTKEYSYNARGEKISETDAKRNTTEYHYDPQGNLIEVLSVEEDFFFQGSDINGVLKQQNHYNVLGLIDREEVFLGVDSISLKTYIYDDLGHLISESISFNNTRFPDLTAEEQSKTATTHYYYDQYGNVVCRKDPNESLWLTLYTTRGMVKNETSPNGGITSYTYDLKDRLKTMTDPLQNHKDENGTQIFLNYDGTITYDYDSLDRLIRATLPQRTGASSAPVISFSYDSVGNLLSRTEPDNSVTQYTYSLQNRVLTETRKNSASGNIAYSTYYTYDKLGRLLEEKPMNNEAYKSSFEYDDLGRRKTVISADGGKTQFGYDLNDNLIWKEDARGFRQFFEYDALNRMSNSIDAEGGTWRYKYHPLGGVSYSEDPNIVIRKSYYDERGSVIQETDGRNHSSYFCYDANGNLDKTRDRNGTLIDYTYNTINLPTLVSYSNSSESQTLTYQYDLAGNIVHGSDGNISTFYNNAELDISNNIINYAPDPFGQITKQKTLGYGSTHQDSRQVSYSYNYLNQLASISHDGNVVNYTYNPMNQISGMKLNDSQELIKSVSYNTRGFLESYTMGNGILVERTYDDKGRLYTLNYKKDLRTLKDYIFGYDLSDNVTSKNDNLYAYDGKNQLRTAMLTGDDVPGEEVEIAYSDTYSVQKDVLGAMELKIMTDQENNFKLEWGARSLGVDITHPYKISKVVLNLQSAVYNYEISRENLQIFTSCGNREESYSQSEIQKIEQVGNEIIITLSTPVMARFIKVHSLIDDRDKNNNPLLSLKTAALNQTTPITIYRMIGGGRNEIYSYDAKGLRTRKDIYTGESFTSSYNYINNSDLLESDGQWYYQYDNNGNLTGKMSVGDDTEYSDMTETTLDWKYSYDLRNRLVKIERRIDNSLQIVAEYVYDINGYRIEKILSESQRTQYVFDQYGNMIQEQRGTEKTDYFFMGNTHIAQKKDNDLSFFSTDHLGSTSLMTDSDGDILFDVEANPFGDQEIKSPFFTGKQWDEDAQLYYFNARWYDPETGRFITEDPVRDGLLWYGYCNNNPMGFVDHTGLSREDRQARREARSERRAANYQEREASRAMRAQERADNATTAFGRSFWGGLANNHLGNVGLSMTRLGRRSRGNGDLGNYSTQLTFDLSVHLPKAEDSVLGLTNGSLELNLSRNNNFEPSFGNVGEKPSVISWPEGDFTIEELEAFKNATKNLWAVYNVHNGTVLFSGWQNENDPGEGYGYHIKIENYDGTISIYSHLDPYYHRSLQVGDFVAAGWHMAFVGAPTNGTSTGPHLHYEKRGADGNPLNADNEIQAALPGLSKITSTFGYRLHPIRGTYYLHRGTDGVGH